MNKFYRAKITCCEVHSMGICAIDKASAAKLAENRLYDYGFKKGEFCISSVKREGFCNWDLEQTLIYN